MSSATLALPTDTDTDQEVIDLTALERMIPSQHGKKRNQPKRNKQEKRDRRHIRKAWEAHGSCLEITYEPVPDDVLREEIACCPPAAPTIIVIDDSTTDSLLDPLQPKSRREIRRARKARLIEEDERKRTFKPRESSYSYINSTKACKHGKNPCSAEREQLELERMQADLRFEERYGVPYDQVIAS